MFNEIKNIVPNNCKANNIIVLGKMLLCKEKIIITTEIYSVWCVVRLDVRLKMITLIN